MGHPADIERAQQLLGDVLVAGASFEEFVDAINAWLVSENCSQEHIDTQIKRVKSVVTYFRR